MREHERGRADIGNAETPPSRPKLVLIVEDEASLVTSVSYYLRKNGFDVASALDGVEGLRATRGAT